MFEHLDAELFPACYRTALSSLPCPRPFVHLSMAVMERQSVRQRLEARSDNFTDKDYEVLMQLDEPEDSQRQGEDLEQIQAIVNALPRVPWGKECPICFDHVDIVCKLPCAPQHEICSFCIENTWSRVSKEQFSCMFCKVDNDTNFFWDPMVNLKPLKVYHLPCRSLQSRPSKAEALEGVPE